MVTRKTAYQALAVGVLINFAAFSFASDASSRQNLVYGTCSIPTPTPASTEATLTVTMGQKRKPTSALEILEEALEKQGLVKKKDEFSSMGPLQKEVVVPTAPPDADMKIMDRDMYAPLLAHYPTRALFLRLGRLLANSMFSRPECLDQALVKGGVDLHKVNILEGTHGIPYSDTPRDNPVLWYKSWGECELNPHRFKEITQHAWKLFEFEYEDMRPGAACMIVRRHEKWTEQVTVGYDVEELRKLNCTLGGRA